MKRLYPLLFVFLWSTGFIGARFGLPHAEPLSFLLVRYLCVIVLLSLIHISRNNHTKNISSTVAVRQIDMACKRLTICPFFTMSPS